MLVVSTFLSKFVAIYCSFVQTGRSTATSRILQANRPKKTDYICISDDAKLSVPYFFPVPCVPDRCARGPSARAGDGLRD